MNVETTTSRFDTIKWLIVTVLVAVAVVGNSYFADQSLLYRVLGIVGPGCRGRPGCAADRQGGCFLDPGSRDRGLRFARWSGLPVRKPYRPP